MYNIFQVDRQPTLRPEAVPCIFPEPTVTDLSKRTSASHKSPPKRRKVAKDTHDDQEEEDYPVADRIPSYASLSESIVQHVHDIYPGITVMPHKNNLLLYCLHGQNDLDIGVSCSMTIRILPDMTIRVFIDGQMLSNRELHWALSHTKGKLKLWSQLENMLSRYGTDALDYSGVTTSRK